MCAMAKKNYSKVFRLHAIEMSEQNGVTVKEVAQNLGISCWLLYQWRYKYRHPSLEQNAESFECTPPSNGQSANEDLVFDGDKFIELKEKVDRLEKEKEVLSRAIMLMGRIFEK